MLIGLDPDEERYMDGGTQSWHPVATEDVPEEGRVRSVTVDGRTIALTRCGGRLGALDNHCPHQGGPLGEVIADETFAGGQVFAFHDDGLADAGDGGHLGLDVTELHADAAQFHLEVDATEAL